MKLAFTKSIRDLTRRPLRTLLTISGIALGVAALVSINATGHKLAEAQRATHASTSQPDITAFVAQASPSLLSVIERRDNVAAVDSRAIQYTRASNGRGWVSTKLIGVEDFHDIELDVPTLIEGRWPERGEVVFDVTARNQLGIQVGDIVALQPTAADATTYSRVSGFARAPATLDASIGHQALAFAPAADVRRAIGSRYDNAVLIKTLDPGLASATANEIERFLARRGVASSGWTVRDPEAFVGSRELTTLLVLLEAFSVLGIVISTFLVANTMAAIMIEERRQIGVLKALGAGRRDILLVYLPVALTFGLLGAAGGLLAGVFGGQAITSYLAGLTGLVLPPFSIRWADLALALSSGLIVSLGAALLPAWGAVRLPASQSLATPGILVEARRGLLHRLGARATGWRLIALLGWRNLPRRPARTWITASVVAVAVAAFVASQAVTQSVSLTVDQLYARYRADGWIFFNRPADPALAGELEATPSVVAAEPWARASGALGSVRTDIWGIPAASQIYRPRLVAGHWLRADRPIPAVLTRNLAERADAQVGSIRRLDIDDRAVLVKVVGIVDDESTYLGATTTGKVFMRFEDLQRLRGQNGRASLFGLQLRDGAPAAVDQALAQLEQRYRAFRPLTLAFYQDQQVARQVIAILTLLLRSVVIIVALVGLFGIANTLLLNLAERRREFGILRALGAAAGQVFTVVVNEGLGLAAIGYATGLAVGYPLARYLVDLTGHQLFRLSFTLSPGTFILALMLALLATAIGSSVPGLLAARLRPVEVLRYE
ncbi:ABC transporter permease [Thermomicrobiaceae bacterium CFH 74404]|uniref:ABC transporter permease n=1 Tax=Thermalbibacter longus TaxID=2951981 RepID=A0AA41WBY3_9BACT|nr:ABC transporter permease [Thermalbibacter longus]MCM8749077.1 ABC transporter permease [Thermalbibacter longus]